MRKSSTEELITSSALGPQESVVYTSKQLASSHVSLWRLQKVIWMRILFCKDGNFSCASKALLFWLAVVLEKDFWLCLFYEHKHGYGRCSCPDKKPNKDQGLPKT